MQYIPGLLHSFGIFTVRRQTRTFAGIGGLCTSTKRKTVNSLCRSKMVDGHYQAFCITLISISLFENVNPLKSNNDRVSECRYSLVTIFWRPQEEFANITSGDLLFIDIDIDIMAQIKSLVLLGRNLFGHSHASLPVYQRLPGQKQNVYTSIHQRVNF